MTVKFILIWTKDSLLLSSLRPTYQWNVIILLRYWWNGQYLYKNSSIFRILTVIVGFFYSFSAFIHTYYFKFPNKFFRSKVFKIFSAQIDNLLNFSLWSLIRIPVKLCKNWSQRSPTLGTRFQEQNSLKTFTIREKILGPSNFQSNINRKSWQLISIREHPSCPLWGFLMKLASI